MSALADRLRAARESDVELEPGKTMRIRRPAEYHMPEFRIITLDLAVGCCIGWSGITEADLFGQGVGVGDAATFDKDACREALGDRNAWFQKVAAGIRDAMSSYLGIVEDAAKN